MKSHYTSGIRRLSALALLLVLVAPAVPCDSHAQAFETKWMAIGDLHHRYSAAASSENNNVGLKWPGIETWTHHHKAKGLWIGARNFTDEQGRTFPAKVVHRGPRELGIGQFFPITFDMISRFEAPDVTVDDFPSFEYPVFIDRIDPSMKADRMIYNVVNTQLGVTVRLRVYAFSQAFHDNYHILDYTFINTGNVDEDAEIELPDQTLQDVFIYYQHRNQINRLVQRSIHNGVGWGMNALNDRVDPDEAVGYPDDVARAQYAWHGYVPSFNRYNNLGGPIWDDSDSRVAEGDTLGRLGAASFVGRVPLHADTSPSDRTDDPGQPYTMNIIHNDDPITGTNDPYNVAQMQEEYAKMSEGRTTPHADIVEPPRPGVSWRERMANSTAEPWFGNIGGFAYAEGFGPYTLAPGDSVRVVIAEGVDGISPEAALQIGMAYKKSGGDDALEIPFDADGDGQIGEDERMTKNEWVMTGRDSLLQTFARAALNFESGFDIPQPPEPPSAFHVNSGPDRIALEWDVFAGSQPASFEIWRAAGRRDSTYHLVAELPASARSYEDADVIRGIGYYYYIQSVGDVNTDDAEWTPRGVVLKSNRFWTQTYDPAHLTRPPGPELASARVVPNPYHLGSDKNVRWPDQQDQIAFLEIPGRCTIQIFTQAGVRVKTIEHTNGSGDAYWNLTTDSNQLIVSGLYVALIEDENTGERVFKKFVVVR